MLITRTSSFTGNEHTLDIDVTEEQLRAYYEGGLTLRDAFPNISAVKREFIKTGALPSEYAAELRRV